MHTNRSVHAITLRHDIGPVGGGERQAVIIGCFGQSDTGHLRPSNVARN